MSTKELGPMKFVGGRDTLGRIDGMCIRDDTRKMKAACTLRGHGKDEGDL